MKLDKESDSNYSSITINSDTIGNQDIEKVSKVENSSAIVKNLDIINILFSKRPFGYRYILNGNQSISMFVGGTYTEKGAVATDVWRLER